MNQNLFRKIPFAHEATTLISSTAKALTVEKWGTITENGDTANQLSSWSLSGVNRNNSDVSGSNKVMKLYWKLTNSTTTRTVSLYKSPAMDSGNLVAQGSRTGDGAITLSEQNSSGINGSVTVAYTADDTNAGNRLDIYCSATYAKVTIDTNAIRYWDDNTVPTDSSGHFVAASATTSSVIELESPEAIMNFRLIRASADGYYSVSYYKDVVMI